MGGTITASLGKWSSRTFDYGSDAMGSFSWIKMRGKCVTVITIITCYRVSQEYGNHIGESTVYMKQETLLRRAGHQTPRPREHCIEALATFANSSQLSGEEVILSIDANDDYSRPTNGLSRLMAQTGLIDVISTRHGTTPPCTYLRGPRRINYILATPNILSSVRKCRHLGIQDGIFSDHVGVWIKLDGRKLFQSPTAHMGTAKLKALNLCDQNKCDRFLQVVDAHMQHQNVDKWSEKLQIDMPYGMFATPAQVCRYGRIAEDVDDAMNAGLTAFYRNNLGYHRSPALTRAKNLFQFWKHQR